LTEKKSHAKPVAAATVSRLAVLELSVITFAVKKWFFDTARVKALLAPAEQAYLATVGEWVRKTAQWSMRYRKGPSSPGSPPSAHRQTGALLREHIYFSLDPQTRTVVVGAWVFPQAEGWNVPWVQEHGWSGTRRIRNWRWVMGMRGRQRRSAWPPPPYAVGDFAVIRATTVLADSPAGRGVTRMAGNPYNALGGLKHCIILRTPAQAERATALREQLFGPAIQTKEVHYPARPYLSAAWSKAVSLGIPARFAREALKKFGLRRTA
jgi:hypothetical protein